MLTGSRVSEVLKNCLILEMLITIPVAPVKKYGEHCCHSEFIIAI